MHMRTYVHNCVNMHKPLHKHINLHTRIDKNTCIKLICIFTNIALSLHKFICKETIVVGCKPGRCDMKDWLLRT